MGFNVLDLTSYYHGCFNCQWLFFKPVMFLSSSLQTSVHCLGGMLHVYFNAWTWDCIHKRKNKYEEPLSLRGDSPNGSDSTGHLGDVQPPTAGSGWAPLWMLRRNVNDLVLKARDSPIEGEGMHNPTLGVNRADIENSSGTYDGVIHCIF